MDEQAVDVTEQDLAQARAEAGTTARNATLGGIGLVVVTYLITGGLLYWLAPGVRGVRLVGLGTAVAAVLASPLLWGLARMAQAKGLETASVRVARERQMRMQGRRREFETRLAKALEMAEGEADALKVTERALRLVVPGAPVELLLADNSHAHLERMVVSSPTGEPPGCPVDSPHSCIAARHGQTEVFVDSDHLDACPKLRDRPSGSCSAVCVPLSIMGRAVGVLHATGPVGQPVTDEATDQLQVLANQVGNRLAMLRVVAETQLQASTDGLTGLLNRRSLENAVRVLRRRATPFVFVMADLDHFKPLNDTHGHEAGDRALRVFAETLRASLRPDDLLCRYGGEEFAIVLPDCSLDEAAEAVERLRAQLALTLHRGDTPAFTASYGLAHADESTPFEHVVARADEALYQAKMEGRNRVIVDQPSLATLPSGNGHRAAEAVAEQEGPVGVPAP